MANKVTIKDIANLTGVSVTTVSNVINGNSHKTSEKTIKKINKVIKELNYIPNYSARSLVNKQSKLIGVIIPQTEEENQVILENPFYSELVSGIEAKLREAGYYMILTGIDCDKSYLDVFTNWNLDGAIILGIYKEQFYRELKKIDVPILLVDSYIDDNDHYHKIGIDDEYGGYLATKYLIDAGHRAIALVTGSIRKDGVEEKRFMGYKRAIEEAGIPLNESLLFHGHVDYEYGVEVGKLIGKIKESVTAVFAVADVVAAGVITGLHNNISVPEEISVMGFDNTSIAKMIVPSLTTVNQNIYEKGVRSSEQLIAVIEGKDTIGKEATMMPLNIVERQSVKKLN